MQKFWAALAVTVTMVAAPVAQSETLADALSSAYKTSNLLAQNQAVLRAADEDAAVAVAKLRPVVEFSANAGARYYDRNVATSILSKPIYEDYSASIGLTSSILIYAGGRGKMGIEVAREAVLATRAGLVNIEQQVLLDAVSAFVNVRLQTEIVSLRESNVRLITRELRAAQDRFDVGEVTLTDVSLAQARLAASRAGLAAAQGALEVARERYKATVGHYPGNLSGLPRLPKTATSEEEARAIAVRSHPSVIQAQHESKIADLRVAIAAGGFLPTVNGSFGLSKDLESGLGNASIGLSASQTLYKGGELSALYRQSMARKESSAAGLHQTVVVVSENVGRSWAALQVANASIEAGSLQVAAAQKAFDGVREEATLGARTTLDVLNAEQELLNARATKLQAEADRYNGVYQLLSVMGRLTAAQLNLGIPTYDAEAYYKSVKSAPTLSKQGQKLDKILGIKKK